MTKDNHALPLSFPILTTHQETCSNESDTRTSCTIASLVSGPRVLCLLPVNLILTFHVCFNCCFINTFCSRIFYLSQQICVSFDAYSKISKIKNQAEWVVFILKSRW